MYFTQITPAHPSRPRRQFAGFGWLLLSLLLLLPLKAGAGGGAPVVLGFTNATLITNNDAYSYAIPSPSAIQVPPLPGALQSVSVTLYGLNDMDTSGIEMLLAGPEGTNGLTVDLMCEAGSLQATGLNLTLADSGIPFPTGTPLTSGTYLPSGDTNSQSSSPVSFPGYSPFFLAGEGGNQLADFAGMAVNVTNTWSLYEFYDSIANGPGGINGGWSLQFTLLPIAPAIATQPATGITASNATLNATVTPNLSATTAYFEYGSTTNYGSFSATNTVASDLVIGLAVALPVSGLPPGATLHFQAVARNSLGTNYGGDMTFATASLRPELAAVPDQTVAVNSTLLVTNTVTNEPPDQITFSLGAGAPAGTSISPGGVFQWTPACEQGSTTNRITVWAIDNAAPPQSNSVSFNVIVGACVVIANQPSLQASMSGNSTFVLTLSGTPGSNYTILSASNLSPPITWTPFTNLTLTSAVQVINAGPFTNRMEFFEAQTSVAPPPAPVLAASLANGPSLVLTLSGNSGSRYAILMATNLSPPITWTTFTNLTLTNAVQAINAGPLTGPVEFFRALQQ